LMESDTRSQYLSSQMKRLASSFGSG